MTADHDAAMDAMVAMREDAELVEQFTGDAGRASLRLTPKGVQLGRAFTMAGDDADADEVRKALLERA